LTEQCANCGSDLHGGFCATCGQSTKDFNVPVGTFAREFASESLELDSRLGLTLRTLIRKPGGVAKEYVSGRRARFVPPVRLYLFASFAVFLTFSFRGPITVQDTSGGSGGLSFSLVGPSGDTLTGGLGAEAGDSLAPTVADTVAEAESDSVTTGQSTGFERWVQRWVQERLSPGMERARADSDAFTQDFWGGMAKAMFVLLPAFALLLKVLYWRRLYVHHLVYAIYLHSFVFILAAFVALPEVFGWKIGTDVLSILLLWTPFYLFLGMRRFYGESRARTAVKFFALTFGYWLLVLTMMLGLLAFTLASA
jgi:hypothetical protein